MGKGLFGRVQSELDARGKTPGLSMADILELPESLRALINWMMRQEDVTLQEISAYLQQDQTHACAMLGELVEKGFVREVPIKGEQRYRVRLAPKRKKDIPSDLWKALDDKIE